MEGGMTPICIYAGNRGLGACAGSVSKVQVTHKRSAAWKGLNELSERLKETKEEPGVCQAHQEHAGENGYLVAVEPAPKPAPKARTSQRATRQSAS
jgi:hypothetical protein